MTYLFVAYTVAFLGLLWYVFMIGRKNSALALQVAALEEALARTGGGPGNRKASRREASGPVARSGESERVEGQTGASRP